MLEISNRRYYFVISFAATVLSLPTTELFFLSKISMNSGRDVFDATKLFLASGTFGDVYRIGDENSGYYAVKRFKPVDISKFLKNRVVSEIEIMKAVCNRDCVHVIDFCSMWEADERIHIQMSFAQHGSLNDLILQGYCYSDDNIYHIVRNVCKAVAYLHERHSIVHLDIKPANILIASQGILKLCDFGLAARFNTKTDDDQGDTR
jgi:serine/threonine protein kinase